MVRVHSLVRNEVVRIQDGYRMRMKFVRTKRRNFKLIAAFKRLNLNQVNPFDELPQEVLPLIFQHLPLIDQVICRRVCKVWKTEVENVLKNTKKAWFFHARHPLLSSGPHNPCPNPKHEVFFEDCVFLTANSTDREIDALMRLCPELEVLVFDIWLPIMTEKVVFAQRNSVVCIRGSQFKPVDKSYSTLPLPRVHHVSVNSLTTTFASSFPLHESLTSLDLDCLSLPDKMDAIRLGLENLNLNFHSLPTNLEAWPARLTLKTLERVEASEFKDIPESIKFPNLTSLQLGYSRNCSGQLISNEVPTVHFPCLRNLNVSLADVKLLLPQLTPVLKQLDSLEFTWDGLLSDDLREIIDLLPKKVSIHLKRKDRVKEDKMVYWDSILDISRNVHHLKLFIYPLKGEDVVKMIRSLSEDRILPNLQSFDIHSYKFRRKDFMEPGKVAFRFTSSDMEKLRSLANGMSRFVVYNRSQRLSIETPDDPCYLNQVSMVLN